MVEGVTSVNWIMVGDYFGRGRFASLMGFMSVFHNIGLIIFPIYAGRVRDTTGSYDLALATLAPLFVVSALAFALARRPPPPKLCRNEPLAGVGMAVAVNSVLASYRISQSVA